MKEAIVHPTPDLWTEIHDVQIPLPEPDEIVIRVVVAGSNPKGKFAYCLNRALIDFLVDRLATSNTTQRLIK